MNSDPPSTWIPLTLKGRAGDELVEQVLRGAGGCGGCNVPHGPFGDRVVGGEVFDRPVRLYVDEEGVDLDELAGRPRFSAFGQTLGVTLAGVEAEAPAAGPVALTGSSSARCLAARKSGLSFTAVVRLRWLMRELVRGR
jgi:hypothetical protein